MAKLDYTKFSDETLQKMRSGESLDYTKLSDDELLELKKQAQPEKSDSVPSIPNDISEMTSAIEGSKKGLLLGSADEIGGAIGAGLEGIFGDRITEEEKNESSSDRIKRLYKEYRDFNRKQSEEAEVANPSSFLGGELIGGSLVPGLGVAKGAVKGLSYGEKILKGAKLAAPVGAITGAGNAEEISDVPSDALIGGLGGAALGGAIPAVGVPLLAGVKGVGKGIGALSKLIPGVEDAILARDYGLKGEKLLGDTARKEIGKETQEFSGKIGKEVKSAAEDAGRELRTLLQDATEDNVKINMTEKLTDFSNEIADNLEFGSVKGKSGRNELNTLKTLISEQLHGVKNKAGDMMVPGKGITDPVDASRFRDAIRQYTEKGDSKFKDPVALKTALDIVRSVGTMIDDNVMTYNKLKGNVHTSLNLLKNLKINKNDTDEKITTSVFNSFKNLIKDNPSGDTARFYVEDLLEKLKEIDRPDLAREIGPKLHETIEKYNLANKLNSPNELSKLAPKSLGIGGYFLGTGERTLKQVPEKFIKSVTSRIGDLSKAAPEQLTELSQAIVSKYGDSAKNLTNKLIKLSEVNDSRTKRAIIYSIMQNPEFRNMLHQSKDESTGTDQPE
jgi:hypothetical protein